jgi:SAM-dependent methyltransferase
MRGSRRRDLACEGDKAASACRTARAMRSVRQQGDAMMGTADGWEHRAAEWLAWARTPGHDAYWAYRDAFFELLPRPSGRALDLGCGEGRVARDLSERGYRMTGLDASATLVKAAAECDPGADYIVGDAHELPFADETFDLVVAYNVLTDVDDMPRAVGEAARVLVRDGHLCVCVTHPLADAGEWVGRGAYARFVVTRPYLRGGPLQEGCAYPFESYARALQAAGLVIESVREPGAEDTRWAHLPMFLMLRCRKPGRS